MFGRALICCLLAAVLSLTWAAPASAGAKMGWGQWVSALSFNDCQARAPQALAAEGLSQENYNTRFWFGSSDGPASATIICYGNDKGTVVTIEVGSTDPNFDANALAYRLSQRIYYPNAQFGGPLNAPAPSGNFNGPGISGTWNLTSNCTFGKATAWTGTVYLSQAQDGSLSGQIRDTLNSEVLPNGTWYSDPQNTQSMVANGQMTLVIHPRGWVSAIVMTGPAGNQISGKAHHYTGDDCYFTMSR